MIKMREMFANNDNVIIPEPLYYSDDAIVMTWEDSVGIDTIASRTEKYNYIMLMWLFNQDCALTHQFIHGDLHEGNWGIRIMSGRNNKINKMYILLDYISRR